MAAATIATLHDGVPEDAVASTLEGLRRAGYLGISGTIAGRKVLIFANQDEPGLASTLDQLEVVAETTIALDGSPLAAQPQVTVRTKIELLGAVVGDGGLAIFAGPCAVESRGQLRSTALGVAKHGAVCLRGGAYKPRTSPYSFQGLGLPGLELLAEAGRETGLPVVTEVVDTESLPVVAEFADVLQIGARNAQNYALLRLAGQTGLPVLLKRGYGSTVDEWLAAAEYILAQGNGSVMLCERGIRTFEHGTRFTLDLSAVPVIKRHSHLPVIVDPSHGTGHRYLVRPMALAAAAAGADGLLIDVHPDAKAALCDGMQALSIDEFAELSQDLERVVTSLGRQLARPNLQRV
jgi:3-deoxy-7-phosphoheptulonate synthase